MAELSETQAQKIKVRLACLEAGHGNLDTVISRFEATGFGDKLALQRLKRRKRHPQDKTGHLGMVLVPDIPA